MKAEVIFSGAVPVFENVQAWPDGILGSRGPMRQTHTYDPLAAETGLFITLSELEPTDVAIVEFSRQYGLVADGLDGARSRVNAMRQRVREWEAKQPRPFPIDAATFSVHTEGVKRPTLVTTDLWACLRLEFNLAVFHGWKITRCEQCGKPFAIIPPAVRKHRAYCSPACSAKAYRKRKAEANATDTET